MKTVHVYGESGGLSFGQVTIENNPALFPFTGSSLLKSRIENKVIPERTIPLQERSVKWLLDEFSAESHVLYEWGGSESYDGLRVELLRRMRQSA